jgi:hypothetical protein
MGASVPRAGDKAGRQEAGRLIARYRRASAGRLGNVAMGGCASIHSNAARAFRREP